MVVKLKTGATTLLVPCTREQRVQSTEQAELASFELHIFSSSMLNDIALLECSRLPNKKSESLCCAKTIARKLIARRRARRVTASLVSVPSRLGPWLPISVSQKALVVSTSSMYSCFTFRLLSWSSSSPASLLYPLPYTPEFSLYSHALVQDEISKPTKIGGNVRSTPP